MQKQQKLFAVVKVPKQNFQQLLLAHIDKVVGVRQKQFTRAFMHEFIFANNDKSPAWMKWRAWA